MRPLDSARDVSAETPDLDRILELADEITILSAHLHAGEHRLLVLLAEYDRCRGWEAQGYRSCADFLAFMTGMDRGAARERVRAARVLEALPETSAAMERGELSFSKVRALTRVATAENETELLEVARRVTAAELERFVRGWRFEGKDEALREELRNRSRRFSVVPNLDGTYEVRGRLEPETALLLRRALDAAADALYARDDGSTPEQRRADALALLAERALAAGFGPNDRAPVSGSRAERYQVVLHVEADGARLDDGTRVSAETSDRLSCDASTVQMEHDGRGSILNVGRKSRTVRPGLRRALEARDGGCRFPGCGLRFTDAHHVEHWISGGETRLDNLLLLCRHHHRLLHEGGFRVEWVESGHPVFFDPRGLQVPEVPPVMILEKAVEILIEKNRERGVDPQWDAASADFRHVDHLPLDVIRDAREALLERFG